MKKKMIIRYGLVVLLILGSVAAYYAYREYNRKAESSDKLEASFEIASDALLLEFTENEKAATEKYSGTVLVVDGLLRAIDVGDRGYKRVVLGKSARGSAVRCRSGT